MERISKTNYFFEIAKVVAKRSTCLHRSVGAILVSPEGRILATGYNGVRSGETHCKDFGCEKPAFGKNVENCRAVHAEENCIIQAAIYGISVKGADCYCTLEPCKICYRHLLAAGIRNIYYLEPYKPVIGVIYNNI